MGVTFEGTTVSASMSRFLLRSKPYGMIFLLAIGAKEEKSFVDVRERRLRWDGHGGR
jgi:hypothetical protein